jgi:hypothetical protein
LGAKNKIHSKKKNNVHMGVPYFPPRNSPWTIIFTISSQQPKYDIEKKKNAMKVHLGLLLSHLVQVQIWATTGSEVIGELTPHPPTVKPKQTHTTTTTTTKDPKLIHGT